MKLIIPKIVAFDSATLRKVSRDYWSQDADSRDKARSFIAKLKHLGIFIAFTLHHVCELLRHEKEQVVQERLKFLRSIPLIAWLRPYNRELFPGSISNLLNHELHAVLHNSARNWQEIINKVRPSLWETGVGHEMFVEDDNLWSNLKREIKYHHKTEQQIASVDRTDPGEIRNLKISEVFKSPIRPKEDENAYLRWFTRKMEKQLDCHGDKRICSHEIAKKFTDKTFQDIRTIEEKDGDIKQELIKCQDVPEEFVSLDMTVGELGELAIYAKRLKMIAKDLCPSIELTMRDVPPDALPSYVMERKLASIQRNAERVSGSDMGDRHMTPLIFYTNGFEVDKRTYEYLNQVQRNEPVLASLMGRFFKSSDYSQILKLFEE